MTKNNPFNLIFEEENKIVETRNKVINYKTEDTQLERYKLGIEIFLNKYPLTDIPKFLVYHYWNFQFLYVFQKKSDQSRSNHILKEFINVSIRIIELMIFLNSSKLDIFIKKYFSLDNFSKCIYLHFNDIRENINNKDICVAFLKENSNLNIFIDTNYYKSYSMPQNNTKNSQNEINWFIKVFKLENSEIKGIFEAESSSKGKDKGGHGSSKKETYDIYYFNNVETFSNRKLSTNASIESKNEFKVKEKQMQSLVFLTNKLHVTTKSIDKYIIDSSYKQMLINKAVSNELTKNSLRLESNYKFPHIIQLKDFVNIIKENNSPHNKLILVSILLGIPIKVLLSAILGFSKQLEYLPKYGKLRTEVPQDIYANYVSDYNITVPIRNKEIYILLPNKIQNMCTSIKTYYKQKNIASYVFIEKEVLEIDKTIKNVLDTLKKTTYIKTNQLHKYLRFFYQIFNKNSDLSILFHINVSANDKAKLCYVNQPNRFQHLENWMIEFSTIVLEEYDNTVPIESNVFIGSPHFIESNKFRSFFDDLDNLYRTKTDKTEKFNIQMIFIRYALSLLLATRDYKESCNLYNHSRRLNLITIHEKAKNLRSSKRIIPLVKLAQDCIELFCYLKNKFQIDGNIPCLLRDEIRELTQKEILEYIKIISTPYEADKICNFIKAAKLNVGRHIFSTLARKSDLNREYEDAFLNHHYLGKVDQGIYSNFSNKSYMSEIRFFINDEIVKEYFPSHMYLLKKGYDE